MSPQSDIRNLLCLISRGDEQAFRQLFSLYAPKVYSFVRKLTHSDTTAEEVVQDIFMKLWLQRASAQEIENFPGYLFTVTRNHTFNLLKRIATENRIRQQISREQPVSHHQTEETVFFHESEQRLKRVVDALPPQQKLVYSLCHHQGLKYEEVAQRLNISRLTVKTHMQQALRTIKSHFTGLASIILVLFS